MTQTLMYVSNGLIVLGFIGYLLLVIFNQNKKTTGGNGFDITKNILDEFDSINIIENKNIFTIYNIKRKVVKIASRCYYGNNVSDIAIPLMEAGISAIDNKHNKYINFFRKIISNLKCLYILPVLAIIINLVSYNVSDVKVSLFFLAIIIIVNYILIDIKSNAYMWLSKNIKRIRNIDSERILRFVNNVLLCDKIIFIGELVMIIRFVQILLIG